MTDRTCAFCGHAFTGGKRLFCFDCVPAHGTVEASIYSRAYVIRWSAVCRPGHADRSRLPSSHPARARMAKQPPACATCGENDVARVGLVCVECRRAALPDVEPAQPAVPLGCRARPMARLSPRVPRQVGDVAVCPNCRCHFELFTLTRRVLTTYCRECLAESRRLYKAGGRMGRRSIGGGLVRRATSHPCRWCGWPTDAGDVICAECQPFVGSARHPHSSPLFVTPCTRCGVAMAQPSQTRASCPACRERSKRAKSMRRRLVAASGVTIKEIGERDGWRCHICRKVVDVRRNDARFGPSIDHLIPIAAGGSDDPSNLALAHRRCNSSRGTGGSAQLRLIA